MKIEIGTIEYTKGDKNFEVNEVKIISQKFHEEEGGYKEPNDTVFTVLFEAKTEDGIITGQAIARRSGFDSNFEIDNVDVSINNSDKEIDITIPDCTIVECED